MAPSENEFDTPGLDEEPQHFKHGFVDYLFNVVSEPLPLTNQPSFSLSSFWDTTFRQIFLKLFDHHTLSLFLISFVSTALSTPLFPLQILPVTRITHSSSLPDVHQRHSRSTMLLMFKLLSFHPIFQNLQFTFIVQTWYQFHNTFWDVQSLQWH